MTIPFFAASFLSALADDMVKAMLKAAGKRVLEKFKTPEKQKAIKKCLNAGLVAITTACSKIENDYGHHLADLFEHFFRQPEVAEQLAPLLRAAQLNRPALAGLFQKSGYDAATLPTLNFDQALDAFEAGFLTAALEEPTIREIINANEMLNKATSSKNC
ncbi:MAG: hypothetical protein ACREOO_01810 [bacterium]